MTIVSKYNIGLNQFSDIRNALRDVFVHGKDESSSVGEITTEDNLSFLINACYAMLENYDWSWSKARTTLTTVASTSTLQLPVIARDKKPINWLYNSTNWVKEADSFEEYLEETFNRTGTGTPRRFSYIEKYTTARTYTTGTVSGTTGEYVLNGTGTAWLENLFCGSTITVSAVVYTVAVVVSDTSLILTRALTSSPALTAYSASTSYPLVQIDLDPVPATALAHTCIYFKKMVPLIADTDVPLLPLNDRWVLIYGAYALYEWFTEQTPQGVQKSGIQPFMSLRDMNVFLTSPGIQQKFYNQFVAKMLMDDMKISHTTRGRVVFKRGY